MRLALVLALALTACDDRTRLIQSVQCGLPCKFDLSNKCNPGTWVCEESPEHITQWCPEPVPVALDLVVLFDTSGSMDDKKEQVIVALTGLHLRGRVALVNVGGYPLQVGLDFTDWATVRAGLRALPELNGNEPTLDALWQVQNRLIPLSWSTAPVSAILFTDERPQSFYTDTRAPDGSALVLTTANLVGEWAHYARVETFDGIPQLPEILEKESCR